MTKSYTVIRFTQVNRKTKQTSPCWVASVSFADGPGYKVKKVSFTTDLTKAAHLSSVGALAIAEQYFSHPIALEFADGTPNVALTAQLVKTQMEKLQNHNEIVRKANDDMKAFWHEMVAAVPELAKFVRLR